MDIGRRVSFFLRGRPRVSFRTYLLLLCMLYLSLAFVFHSHLQYTITVTANAGVQAERSSSYTAVYHHHNNGSRKPAEKQQQQLQQQQQGKQERLRLNDKSNEKDWKQKAGENSVDVRKPAEKLPSSSSSSSLSQSICGHESKLSTNDARFQEVAPKVYIYSAYFDDRKQPAFIRIISVTQGRPALFCHFATDAQRQVTQATYYEMCENHGRQFKGFILSCPVPTLVTMPVCSIEFGTSPEKGSVKLDVRSLKPRGNPRNYSVCVPPLFGPVNRNMLIEFIEMSRLLGAEHITFYNMDMKPEILNILKFYQRQNIVSVLPWRLPHQVNRQIWYHGQLISIEDCLYRNMATTEFLTFNDIDEFIVPRNMNGWPDLIKLIHKDDHCGYSFQSVFFDPVKSNNSNVTNGPLNYLRVARDTHRSRVISRIRTKCLVQPRKIFEMGIHHISKPNEEFYKVIKVDTNLALLHHYRKCLSDFGMRCLEFVRDGAMDRHIEQLHKQFQTVNSQISPH